jgi:hypothetical protein
MGPGYADLSPGKRNHGKISLTVHKPVEPEPKRLLFTAEHAETAEMLFVFYRDIVPGTLFNKPQKIQEER